MLALLFLLAVTESQAQAPLQPPPPPPPVQAPQLTKLPQLLESPPADYPPERLAKGESADVACLIDIDATGAVVNAVLEKPAEPDFDAAALAALTKFKFSPAEVDGKPAQVRIRYVYHFVIAQKHIEAPKAATGTVHGEVVEAGNRKPIAGADVSDDTGAAAVTDAKGEYRLEAPEGERKLTVSAPGFEKRTQPVKVVAGTSAEARRTWLHRTSVGDLQATIPGDKPDEAPTRRTLSHDELVNVPGSLNDPIRAVQNLPGLARAPFLGGQLLVRGTPPQDTGTYLDGHRIPQLYHFLGGPSVINEELLDRIDFYPGGYGAYYGRNLTGAIDVGTKKGDATGIHGQASVDLLQAVGFLEGPIDKNTQFEVAARRSYIDVFLPLFIPNDPKRGVTSIVPVYWDYQARADHKLGNGDEISLLFFGSDDKLSIVQKGGTQTLPISLDTHLAFHRAIFDWKHTSGDLTLTLSPALGWTKQSFSSDAEGLGPFGQPQTADITDLTAEVRGEARYKVSGNFLLRAGMDLQFDRASYSADLQSQLQILNLGLPITQELTFSRIQPVEQWGEYVEGQFNFGKLSFVPGLRLDEFHWLQHARFSADPRLWARYTLSPETSLKAYTGVYHEPPSGQQIDKDLGNPDLDLEWGLQFGTGLEHRFSDLLTASAEVFYNRRGALIVRVDPTLQDGQVVNPRLLNDGIGRAFGLEVLLRREITSQIYGFLAYTLSKSQILQYTLPGQTPQGQDGQWQAFQYDQTHILTIVAGYRPTPKWEFSTRFRLVSGNPYAPVDGSTFDADSGTYVSTHGNFGDAREPLFLQLDVRAQKTWTFDVWSFALYLDVENVTNHLNEEFHVYDYRFRDQGSIQGLPILPTFGVKGKF
jgi:TonB family protein